MPFIAPSPGPVHLGDTTRPDGRHALVGHTCRKRHSQVQQFRLKVNLVHAQRVCLLYKGGRTCAKKRQLAADAVMSAAHLFAALIEHASPKTRRRPQRDQI